MRHKTAKHRSDGKVTIDLRRSPVMRSLRVRNSTRARRTRFAKHTPRSPNGRATSRLPTKSPLGALDEMGNAGDRSNLPRRPASIRRKATGNTDLYAILQALAHAISVVRTAKQSLERDDTRWDEVVTLDAAITMLRQVDVKLNDVADGRPSRICLTQDDETTWLRRRTKN